MSFTLASDIICDEKFCDELDQLRQKLRIDGDESIESQQYYTGLDYNVLFEDCYLRVLIADMYTAVATPDFLFGVKEPYSAVGPIDVIVNLLGSPQLLNHEYQLYGAASHWNYDMQLRFGASKSFWQEYMTPPRVCAWEEYLLAPEDYYKRRGVYAYIESACADGWNNLIALQFPELVRRIMVEVNKIMFVNAYAANCRDGHNCINVVFHCYGGQNRSAAAACAFWYCWTWRYIWEIENVLNPYVDGSLFAMPDMYEVIRQAVCRRPTILVKQHYTHRNFIRNLLLFAAGVGVRYGSL